MFQSQRGIEGMCWAAQVLEMPSGVVPAAAWSLGSPCSWRSRLISSRGPPGQSPHTPNCVLSKYFGVCKTLCRVYRIYVKWPPLFVARVSETPGERPPCSSDQGVSTVALGHWDRVVP